MNKIGDVGAQYIGGGLKSLKSLTTFNLSGECCEVYHIDVFCVCVCVICRLNVPLFNLQEMTLETLEHSQSVMVSSQSHHSQHWIWVVSVV